MAWAISKFRLHIAFSMSCWGNKNIFLHRFSTKDSNVHKLNTNKKPRSIDRGFMLALPIFTASHPATIVGVHVLNFCVRDGNRWTHMTINTNSLAEEVFPFLYSAVLPRISVIRRSSLLFLVTHTGFEPMLTAWEAAVLTTWPMGHWCTFRDSNPGPTD